MHLHRSERVWDDAAEHGDVDVPPAQRHHHLLNDTPLNLLTKHTLIHNTHTYTFTHTDT